MSDFPALDDFNDFSAPSGGGGGSQADFLARERELLGDEFGPTPTGIPSATEFDEKPSAGGLGDFDTSAKSPPTAAAADNDFMSSFERDPAPAPAPAASNGAARGATVQDDDEDGDALNQFSSNYPAVELYPNVQQQQQQSSYSQPQNGYSNDFSQPTTIYAQTSSQSAEPETDAIRAWREKQQADIAERDRKSASAKEDIVRKAEAAIDDFYHSYNQKKERQIAQNKEDEAAFVQARDDALARGTTWERIADLIELQDSRSKTVAKGTRDLSRMKEVLLTLKREGENAPNATGY